MIKETPPWLPYVALGVVVAALGLAIALYINDQAQTAGGVLAVAAAAAASSGMLDRGRDQAKVESAHESVTEGREDVTDALDDITESTKIAQEAHANAEAEVAALDRDEKAKLADELFGDA